MYGLPAVRGESECYRLAAKPLLFVSLHHVIRLKKLTCSHREVFQLGLHVLLNLWVFVRTLLLSSRTKGVLPCSVGGMHSSKGTKYFVDAKQLFTR